MGVARNTVGRPPTLRAINARNAYDAKINHILRASAQVFAEKTYGLATLRDIAERAQITVVRYGQFSWGNCGNSRVACEASSLALGWQVPRGLYAEVSPDARLQKTHHPPVV